MFYTEISFIRQLGVVFLEESLSNGTTFHRGTVLYYVAWMATLSAGASDCCRAQPVSLIEIILSLYSLYSV